MNLGGWGRAFATLAVLGGVAGCATAPPPQPHPLTKRAPFDLNCNQPLGWYELGKNSWGARGCGRQVTYAKQCHDTIDSASSFLLHAPVADTECQWVLESVQAIPVDPAH
jgi:hypothetical protein